jgi:hypothetical protein
MLDIQLFDVRLAERSDYFIKMILSNNGRSFLSHEYFYLKKMPCVFCSVKTLLRKLL